MYNSIVALLLVACAAGSTTAFQCFTCTTLDNPFCLQPDNRQLVTECPPNPQATGGECFTRIVGQDVQRGCASSLTVEEQGNCSVVNNCQLCLNENNLPCNDLLFPHGRLHCHQCNGTTNSTCAAEIQTEATSCLRFAADDQCIVQVRQDTVVRGCLSENLECRGNRDCHVCSGNGCNFRHFEYNAAGSLAAQLPLLLGAILLSVFVVNHKP